MLCYYTNKISIVFLICLIIIIKTVKGDLKFDIPSSINNHVNGFLGYKCNFSADGIHNLEPDLLESRSIFCSINSYFIYDKIKLIIPKKKDESSKFKLLPDTCFKKVFKDAERTVEADIADIGLIDYEINEDNSFDYIEKNIIISPFNDKDIEFFCFCDNSEKVISDVKGRTALVHVRVLKYPHNIISINLTDVNFYYLNNPKTKDDFENNNLEIHLSPGELLVLACDKIDNACFQRKKGKTLYKSNKIIYHNKFAIFKAPVYINTEEMEAICTCKVDNIQYNIIVKPKNEKKEIHGCDFTSNEISDKFTKSINLEKIEDNEPVNCEIELNDKNYSHIIGIKCPGEIIPNCFFQVYQFQEKTAKETQKIVYLDSHLNVGDIEYYDDVKSENKMKIFSIIGGLRENKHFTCLCKKDKKTGYMIVKMASAYYGFFSKIFLFILVILLLYHS